MRASGSQVVSLIVYLALPAGGLSANPGGHWSFDGGTPGEAISRVDDQSPAGNPLVAIPGESPPTYTSGINGDTAARFDGNQALEVGGPNGADLYDFRTDNTTMAWVQIEEGNGGVIWQMSFRPRVFNPNLGVNFGVTTKAMWIGINGFLRTHRPGNRSGHALTSDGLRLDDGTPHHVALVWEPQKTIDVEVSFDCDGDSDIDMDDVDGAMNPCVLIEDDVVDLETVYVDGVEVDSSIAIEARRSKARGSLWVGKGSEGERVPLDQNFDGIQDQNANGELLFEHANSFPFARCPQFFNCIRGTRTELDANLPLILEEVGMEGVIDELKFFRGALTAEEIQAESQNETPDCTGKANATVTAVDLISSPAHGETGPYEFAALGANNPEGDEILYSWRAIRTGGDPFTADDLQHILVDGPASGKSRIRFVLPAGTYEVEVTVDDSVRCPDAPVAGGAATHVARSAPVVVAPFSGAPGYRHGNEGGSKQIYYDYSQWFDRSPDDNTFWETVTGSNSAHGRDFTFRHRGGGGRLTFFVDIGRVGGQAGTWFLWTRLINPQNASDFGSMEGDPEDILDLNIFPKGPPWPGRGSPHPLGYHTFANDDRLFEFNAGPSYEWSRSAIGSFTNTNGQVIFIGQGHTKELRDGLNRHFIFNRQGAPNQRIDVLCWTDDPFFTATDQTLRDAVPVEPPFNVVFFSRGDGNGDSKVDIADPSFIANFVFGVGAATTPSCLDAADSNGDGEINIADVAFSANFVARIRRAAAPPPPGPTCGVMGVSYLVLGCESPPASCEP